MDKNFRIEFSVIDPEFAAYVNKRMTQVFNSKKQAYNYRDEKFERISENLELDDRYFSVYIPYLTYKLNNALLIKKRWKRENELWWIWKTLMLDFTLFPYLNFMEENSLPQRVIGAVMDILSKEYASKQNQKKSSHN